MAQAAAEGQTGEVNSVPTGINQLGLVSEQYFGSHKSYAGICVKRREQRFQPALFYQCIGVEKDKVLAPSS